MEFQSYDVVIIGAGPAGLATALSLKGKSVFVAEKNVFPRYKCCAGYVTEKTKKVYAEFGLNLGDCYYSLIKDFNILYKNKRRLTVRNKFLYTNRFIDRVELDDAFFRLAKSKGIEIAENSKIVGHEPDKNLVTLSDGKTVGYKTLVFADGTSGFGARYQKSRKKNIALQMTFPDDRAERIDIHFGITRHGYGWASSMTGVTNVGLTDVYNPKLNYREIFSSFLSKLNITADLSRLRAAFTPIGVGKGVVNKNVFFVGDAVGACDPMTLSGLRYGLKSGERCAEAISTGRTAVYKKYLRSLKVRFAFMRFIQKAFYFAPVTAAFFNAFCRLFGRTVAFMFNRFFVNKK